MTTEILGINLCPICRTPITLTNEGKVDVHDMVVHRFFGGIGNRPCPGVGKSPIFIELFDYMGDLKKRAGKISR